MKRLERGKKKMRMEWLKNNGGYLLLFTIVFFLILGVGIFTVNVVYDNIQSQHIMNSESVVVDKYIKVNDKGRNEYFIKTFDGDVYIIRGKDINDTEFMYHSVDLHHKYHFVVRKDPMYYDVILRLDEL